MASNFQHLYKEKSRKNERSHRSNVLIELRNERRVDMLQKRRLEPSNGELYISHDMNSLENAIIMCQSENVNNRAEGILTLRRAIYSEIPECEMIVCRSEFVSLMINLLNDFQNPNIQFDAACVLANLTIKYTNIKQFLVNDETIKILFNYLNPANDRLCENILWIIANIIQDNPKSIKLFLGNNIIGVCQQIICTNPPIYILKNISALLLNFTGKRVITKSINPGIVSLIIPIVKHLINCNDENILSNILWIIANINDTTIENVVIIIESGILQTCKELLTQTSNENILHPVIRLFGNIVTNDDEITQYVIDMGLFGIISSFINYNDPVIQRECLWFISNIAAGSNSQMTLILDHNLLGHVIDRLMNGSKIVVREALWVISNILYTALPTQIQLLLNINLIECVCKILKHTKDTEMINLCLECFNFSFDNSGIEWSELSTQIELYGGIDSIESLQNHKNKKISDNAAFILDQYICTNDSTNNEGDGGTDWIDDKYDESHHMYEF